MHTCISIRAFLSTPNINPLPSITLCHMDKWGGHIAFAGVGAAENTGIAFGGVQRFSLGLKGQIAFAGLLSALLVLCA